MRESLRARLLFWHVATGAAIILAFGASVCVLVWHTGMVAIDATLAAHAAQLEDAVLPTGEGQVDLITTTFGKACGGASGGCISGNQLLIDLVGAVNALTAALLTARAQV